MSEKKSPLFILVADPHVSDTNGQTVFDLFTQVKDAAIGKMIKRIVIAGDLFKWRKAQSLSALMWWIKILKMLTGAGLEVYAIDGNHDKVLADSEDSYVAPFQFIKGFVYTSRYEMYDMNGVAVHLVSYFGKEVYAEVLSEAIACAKKNKDFVNILVSHNEVNGAKMNDGGILAESETEYQAFKAFTTVCMGHFHNKSVLGKRVHFVGSMCPDNFGEDNDKGFTIVYDDGSLKAHNLEFKKYETHKVSVDDVSAEDLDTFLESYGELSDTHVRVVFSGSKAAVEAVDTSRFLSAGISVKLDKTVEGEDSDETSAYIEFTDNALVDAFGEFCDERSIKKTDAKLGKKYLKQTLEKQ